MNRQATATAQTPVHQQPIQTIQESLTIPARCRLHQILNQGLYYVFQRKYGLDGEPRFTRFQKWYHANVWLRFARFSKRVVGVPSGNGTDKNGDIFWTEHQGFVFEEWQAEQAIARYQSAGWHLLPLMEMLPGETLPDMGNHGTQTNGEFRKNGKPTVEIAKLDLVKLAAKTASTDKFVERFQYQL